MWAVGVVGAVVMTTMLLGAAIAWHLAAKARADLRRLTETPATPIAHAVRGTVVQLCGTVVPSEQGVIRSPSGLPVVLYEARASWERHRDLSGGVKEEREFWLQDETGACARIIPSGARLHVRATRYRHQSAPVVWRGELRCVPMSPEIHSWATSMKRRDAPDLVVDETLIAPGQRVLARGLAEGVSDGTVKLRHHSSLELFLSTLSESEVQDDHRREVRINSTTALICLGVSGVGAMLVAGAILGGVLLR